MKIWEPKSVLCCSLRSGIMTCVIIRIILMLIGVILCTTDVIIIHLNHNGNLQMFIPVEITIASTIIAGCLISLIFCGLLIHGVKKNKPNMYVAFVVWQELEALVILSLALLVLVFSAAYKQIGIFILTLIVSGGILVYTQCFILAIRAYHLKMKRLRTGDYVEFRKGEEEEEEEATPPVDT